MQQFEARQIGERISQARRERGMTQEELAEIASFSKRSLQDYEGGVTIPYRHLRELSRLLGHPPEWFLYGEDLEEASALDQAVERLEALAETLGEAAQKLAAVLEAQADSQAARPGT